MKLYPCHAEIANVHCSLPTDNKYVRSSNTRSLERKCTLAASHASPGESRWVAYVPINVGEKMGQNDGHQTDALRLLLDAASVMIDTGT